MNGNTPAYLQLYQRLRLTPIPLKLRSKEPLNFQVRLVPDLSAAAFRSKKTKELALWYILRALNLSGSGVIENSLVLEQLQQTFNYSQRTVYEHLALGEGQFWRLCKWSSLSIETESWVNFDR